MPHDVNEAYKAMLEGHGEHGMEKMFLAVQELVHARRECPQEYVKACAGKLPCSNALLDAAMVGYTSALSWLSDQGMDVDMELVKKIHDESHARAMQGE